MNYSYNIVGSWLKTIRMENGIQTVKVWKVPNRLTLCEQKGICEDETKLFKDQKLISTRIHKLWR